MGKGYDIADELEAIVDSLGVAGTLEALASICREKAAHIRENWQDFGTAKQWDKFAAVVDGAEAKARKVA